MRKPLSALYALLAIAPLAAFAQTTTSPSPVPTSAAGVTAPSGADTPVSPVPGAPSEPSNAQPPTIDSSGVNQSSAHNATGAVMPPPGAPRLPGVPMNPPTGPTSPP